MKPSLDVELSPPSSLSPLQSPLLRGSPVFTDFFETDSVLAARATLPSPAPSSPSSPLASPAPPSPAPHDATQRTSSVTIHDLLEYLITDVDKRQHYRHLPFYFLFLLGLLLFAGLGEGALQNNIFADANLLNRVLTEQIAPRGVDSEDKVWEWVKSAAGVLWDARAAGQVGSVCNAAADGGDNAVIGGFVLRQWRVDPHLCHLYSSAVRVLPLTTRRGLPCSCSPPYSEDDHSRATYGTNTTFFSDEAVAAAQTKYALFLQQHGHHPLGVATKRQTYRDTGRQYSAVFFEGFFEDLGASAAEAVEGLRVGGWIDSATRVVSLESTLYNADTQLYTRSSCYIEFFQTGAMESGCVNTVFSIRELDGDYNRFLLVLDVFLTVSLVAMAVSFVKGMLRAHQLRPAANPLGFWMVFNVVHMANLTWLLYARYVLWAKVAALLRVSYTEDDAEAGLHFFHVISDYSIWSRESSNALAICLIVSFLRVFKYFQHFGVLNVLSETIKYSAHHIVRLAGIFSFVLAGYALCGTLLFSPSIADMETVSATTSWLLRILFIQYEFDWAPLIEAHPIWTTVFLGSYFAVCYFLLLNMFLAVVVNAFDHVRKNHELESLQREARANVHLDEKLLRLKHEYTSPQKHRHHDHVPMQSRFHKIMYSILRKKLCRLVSKNVRRVSTRVAEILKKMAGTDRSSNYLRIATITLIKQYCVQESGVPLHVLEEQPLYYKRVTVSLERLRSISAGHLDDKDLRKIFEGVQTSGENELAPLVLTSICERLSALEESGRAKEAEAMEQKKMREQMELLQRRLRLWRPRDLDDDDGKEGGKEALTRERALAEQRNTRQLQNDNERRRLQQQVADLTGQVSQMQQSLFQCWEADHPTSPLVARAEKGGPTAATPPSKATSLLLSPTPSSSVSQRVGL